MKFLNRVTITGADDNISPTELFSLSLVYPFVEWGILVSQCSYGQGTQRYPSEKWLQELFLVEERERCSPHVPNESGTFSLHICGRWVRDICEGKWTIIDEIPNFPWNLFGRIQLNFSPYIERIDPVIFVESIPEMIRNKQIIFQINPNKFDMDKISNMRKNITGSVIFYDGSGGVGVEPETWSHPCKGMGTYFGFAGGLDPLKLESQLSDIALVVDEGPCWIDVETRVRSEQDKFDAELVMMFLEKSKSFLKDNWYES